MSCWNTLGSSWPMGTPRVVSCSCKGKNTSKNKNGLFNFLRAVTKNCQTAITISLQIWNTHSFFYFTMVLRKKKIVKFFIFFWCILNYILVIQWSKRINGSKLNSRKNKYHFYKVKFIGQSHKFMKRNDTSCSCRVVCPKWWPSVAHSSVYVVPCRPIPCCAYL